MFSLCIKILDNPVWMKILFNSFGLIYLSTDIISVLGTITSLALTFENSKAFWKI